jgi:RimJ/RimL family protein N-acetyltransferase
LLETEKAGGQSQQRRRLGWTYATEAARDWYETPRLVSLIPPDNVRSQAVARRHGAVPQAEVHLPADGTYVVWEH